MTFRMLPTGTLVRVRIISVVLVLLLGRIALFQGLLRSRRLRLVRWLVAVLQHFGISILSNTLSAVPAVATTPPVFPAKVFVQVFLQDLIAMYRESPVYQQEGADASADGGGLR